MSTNSELVQQFERMAAVLEILGESRFRIMAYERAARVLDELGEDVSSLAGDRKKLVAIDGIGNALADKIIEYVETGHVAEIEAEIARVPEGLPDLLEISGLGPKTVALLWQEAGVTSLDDLQAELEGDALEELPGLGKKKLDNIRKGLAQRRRASTRVRIEVALRVAERMVAELEKVAGVARVEYAGSLRRGRETIGDVDILVGCEDPEQDGPRISEAFRSLPEVEEVLWGGATKSSIRAGGIQVDLRIVPMRSYGAALLYFTGSKEHNVVLREWSIKKYSLHLNEYGLWRAEDFEAGVGVGEPVAGRSEAEVYEALGFDFIPPELRENRGEHEAARKHQLPRLIEIADIRSDLHIHTVASDGSWTVAEAVAAARTLGYHTIAITDHSPLQPVAKGLDVAALERHATEIRALDRENDAISIIAGTEVDILPDGSLDYPDEVLAGLDLVIASPHVALGQDAETATRRLVRAIENPYVHMIGHPTGRLIGERDGLPLDGSRIIQAALETGTALEINAVGRRLDLNDVLARAAADAGVLLSINTDTHGGAGFSRLQFGVLTARRAWIQAQQVVNCFSATELRTWLARKRNPAR